MTYEDRVVVVGSGEGCVARIEAPGVAPQHARLEFKPDECQFHLRRGDGHTFVNGVEIDEVILQDDDQIELGVDGPMLRFRAYWPTGSVCKPVRKMLTDARAVARVSGGAAATETLTRDLLTQATLQLKVFFPLFVVGGAFLAGWLGGWIGRPDALVTRDEIEALHAQQAEMRRHVESVKREDIEALRAEQKKQQDDLAKLARANVAVRRIQKEWSRGVCRRRVVRARGRGLRGRVHRLRVPGHRRRPRRHQSSRGRALAGVAPGAAHDRARRRARVHAPDGDLPRQAAAAGAGR
jgi:hypothetical protein